MITSGDQCIVPLCEGTITFRGVFCHWCDALLPGHLYTRYLRALRVQGHSLTNLLLAATVIAETATTIGIKRGSLPRGALAAVTERYRAAVQAAWRKEIEHGHRHQGVGGVHERQPR